MKSTTVEARAMSDAELLRSINDLKRRLPRMHSLQDAVKREYNRRKRNQQKVARSAVEMVA